MYLCISIDCERVREERCQGMYTSFSSFVAFLCAFGGETRCAICRETLTCQSHQVYISSRSAKDCAETEKELNGLGPGQCISIPADMQKLEQVEHLVAELSKREKALHVLVNNAGSCLLGMTEEIG